MANPGAASVVAGLGATIAPASPTFNWRDPALPALRSAISVGGQELLLDLVGDRHVELEVFVVPLEGEPVPTVTLPCDRQWHPEDVIAAFSSADSARVNAGGQIVIHDNLLSFRFVGIRIRLIDSRGLS